MSSEYRIMFFYLHYKSIDHFAVVCLAAWPLNEIEDGVDLVLKETSLLFFCKSLLGSMRTALVSYEKQGVCSQNKGCLPFNTNLVIVKVFIVNDLLRSLSMFRWL